MAHHKKKKQRNATAGCKMCKPWKINGACMAHREKHSDRAKRDAADQDIKGELE